MALRSVLTTLALSTVLAVPAAAQQRERHRQNDNREQSEQTERTRAAAPQGDRAVARTEPRSEGQSRRDVQSRQDVQPRQDVQSRQDVQRRQDLSRQEQARAAAPRSNGNNGNYANNDGRYANNGRYDNRGYTYGGVRRYDSRNRYYYYYPAPRVIYPTVVRVVPYRPYVYRPSFSVGVYYGSGGYYPYGYTPSYYYQPVPGRPYGGLRITGAPRDARVFADGYFVGIVNDFDGIFQHLNLEAGSHHIEIDWGGYQPMAFDVYVRPGETTTFHAGY
jgi:hypothetical protein